MPADDTLPATDRDILLQIQDDLKRLSAIERELKELKELLYPADNSQPMTAKELVEHLEIGGKTPKHQLRNLNRQCAFLRIEPIGKPRGWRARYDRRKVLSAVENA